MESILRGAVTYLFLLLVFRIAGKRSLAQITTFDAVLLLIISETTQAALTDADNSLINSLLLILTLLGIDIFLSCLKHRFKSVERLLDGTALVLVDENGMRSQAMDKERIDKEDILHAAREQEGLANMDQIEYAVLEHSGGITVIPKQSAK